MILCFQVSETYADVTAQPADMMITRYFGVFFMFYMMAQVWGNLITSSGIHFIFQCCVKNAFDLTRRRKLTELLSNLSVFSCGRIAFCFSFSRDCTVIG